MKNERTANQALADYNEKEYAMRQQWAKVLGSSSERNSKLAAPVKRTERKPVAKLGFFSKFFKAA